MLKYTTHTYKAKPGEAVEIDFRAQITVKCTKCNVHRKFQLTFVSFVAGDG